MFPAGARLRDVLLHWRSGTFSRFSPSAVLERNRAPSPEKKEGKEKQYLRILSENRRLQREDLSRTFAQVLPGFVALKAKKTSVSFNPSNITRLRFNAFNPIYMLKSSYFYTLYVALILITHLTPNVGNCRRTLVERYAPLSLNRITLFIYATGKMKKRIKMKKRRLFSFEQYCTRERK